MTQPLSERKLEPQSQEDYRPRNWEPTSTLDRAIAEARASMGEERWNELQAEWSQPPEIARAIATVRKEP